MADKKNIGIVIDDGSERVPIVNKFGDEIGVFYFRPTDIGIVTRFNEIQGKLDNVADPLKNIDVNPDGTTDGNASDVAALSEATENIKELIDYLFGGNASEAFFGKMNPFSIVGGEFYFYRALELTGDYIEKRAKEESKKFDAKVSKYTKKYQ